MAARTPPAGWRSASRSTTSPAAAARARTGSDARAGRCRSRLLERSFERQLDQPRMPEHALDHGVERAEPKSIAGEQRRRQRPLFGRRAMVPGTEDHRDEAAHPLPRQRAAPGQPHLDGGRRRLVLARQAGRQRRGVVGDDDVSRPAPGSADRARGDGRAGRRRRRRGGARPRCAGRWPRSWRHHRPAARSRAPAVARTCASINSAISTAASRAASARRRSASGTASACIGVSMSPGSTATASMPRPTSSSRQMRVR